ncbi:TetR/AcrR family transcriptional regulator [Curtobacterium sp. MCBD17_013]|nr:TetR/AcrR family transcriptional regulator [Curtobacterium sp. MCBD17_013]
MSSVSPASSPTAAASAGSAASPATRMPAAERRVLILDIARTVFGRRGYHGTTTDQIASAAGISQPYVVRMFGTKERLFLEVLADTLDTLMAAFRTALDGAVARGEDEHGTARAVGNAYLDLAATRGFHTLLLQAFVSGADPAIGAAARAGFLEIYRFLVHDAGFTPERVHEFLGSGMLFSVLLGIEMPGLYDTDDDAAALMQASFGDKCAAIVDAARSQTD